MPASTGVATRPRFVELTSTPMKTPHYLLLAAVSSLLAACQPSPTALPSEADQIVAGIATTRFPDRCLTLRPDTCLPSMLPQLQQAIDSCSLMGGGTVRVEAGLYPLDGTLWLKSNVCLHLCDEAVLRFSGVADDYLPVVPTRFEGTELFGHSPMIYAYHQQNIAITGHGEIDAQAGVEMAAWGRVEGSEADNPLHGAPGDLVEKPYVSQLRQMGEDLTPVEQRVFGQGTKLRPTCVETYGCSRVLIEGVTIRNSPFWTIHPLYSDNVIVRGVTIDSHFPNNDGCDPESSSNVLIEHCTFRCGDDAVAIKAGRDADGRRVGRPSERIVIRHCDFRSECNGLCIGSEMSGGVQDVWMDDIRIGTVKNALYFKSNSDRGGFIRGIHISNVSIERSYGAILRFETNYFGYRGGHYPAIYEDFTIEHVEAEQADAFAVYYDGNEERPIRNVRVDDLHVAKAPQPYYLRHTESCTFTHCTLNGQPMPEEPEQSVERQSCDVW